MHFRQFAIILVIIFIIGCAPPPSTPAYIISGSGYYPSSSVHVADLDGPRIIKTISMPSPILSSPAVDQSGRLWIGLAGSIDKPDNRVAIIDQSGKLISELTVGEAPEAGISFSGNSAFIVCRNRGFYGSVWVVRTSDLAITATIDLPHTPYEYSMVTASAADDQYLVIASQRTPPPGDVPVTGVDDLPYSEIFVLDTVTLDLVHRIDLGAATAFWDIVPAGDGTFYLINNAGFSAHLTSLPVSPPGDIIHFDARAGNIIDRHDIGGFPLRGQLSGDDLIVYCRIWSSILIDDRRAWVRFNTHQHTYKRLVLTQGFAGTDISTLDHIAYITAWSHRTPASDGIYRFGNDEPELILRVKGASAIVIPGR